MYKIVVVEQTNVSSELRLQQQFDTIIISVVYKIIMYGPHDERSYINLWVVFLYIHTYKCILCV